MTYSKLYWNLRAGGAFKPIKYQTTYLVTSFHFKNKRRPWASYPSNKWGYGWFINKHKRQQKNERSPLLQQWYANLESKTK